MLPASIWAALIDALLRVIPEAVEFEDARHLIVDPLISPDDGQQAKTA